MSPPHYENVTCSGSDNDGDGDGDGQHAYAQHAAQHIPATTTGTLRFGGQASPYHAAAIMMGCCAEEGGTLESGRSGNAGSNDTTRGGPQHRRSDSADTLGAHSADESFSSSKSGNFSNMHHYYPPLSQQAQNVLRATRRRLVLTTVMILLGGMVLYGSGYRAGKRHEDERLGLSTSSTAALAQGGAKETGATETGEIIVADESLLDADDDTVEELTAEEANDLDVEEIMEEAQEVAKEEEELLLLEEEEEQQASKGPSKTKTKTKYQKFLIFAEQRSGSRFLTDLLDDHPQIVCGNEELNHKDTPMNLKHMDVEEYMDLLDETYDNVLSMSSKAGEGGDVDVDAGGSSGGILSVGFKIMYNQGVTHFGKDLMARLDAAGVKVIHLIRRNKLLQYISFASNEKNKHLMADQQAAAAAQQQQLAEKGEQVMMRHQAHPKTKEDAQRIRDELSISGKHPEKILNFIKAREDDDREVANLVSAHLDRSNYVFVDYEDLSDKTEEEMGRLFALLDVEQRRVQSHMEKIHEGKLTRDYFRKGSQDAVKQALEASEFKWMLDGW